MPDFENGFTAGSVFYIGKENGEMIPFTGLTTVKLEDAENPDHEEDDSQVFATISTDMECTITFKQTHKWARKTHKFFNAYFNSYRRRVRSWKRTKERLRRAKLKGKEYVGASPRICGWLRYHQSVQEEDAWQN